ncbi:MAG: Rpn family recombination-promoting nuclease/putative transposase [Kiritimatiellae bacterium]|nr:Rpn family recombination-promoting nuclease/putative transposase [Kiritimatiellia bacterium]
MAKYLDPKADVTFKKVFGEHKNLVTSLLNALLPLEDGKKVESIEYLPAELVPRTPIDKDTSVDVRCRETGGRTFIVEMQMNWRASFRQRVLFNASKVYVKQLDRGEEYALLQPVYSLNLVNDTFEPDMEDYYHYYRLVHYLHSDKVLDGLHLVFVELPKFRAGNLAEKKMQVLWLRFLTEIGEATKEAPQDLVDNPQVSQALGILEESAYNEAEMYAYDRFWDYASREATREADWKRAEAALEAVTAEREAVTAERDAATAERDAAKAERDAATAERDAATARAEAAEKKLRQDKFQIARNLKIMGLATEQIVTVTGLSPAEIDSLKC